MGLTRKRELAAAALLAAVLGFLVLHGLYRYFPPITGWTGLSLLAVAGAEAWWATSVRGRIRDRRIGVGAGRLHPLAVARTLAIAKASAWAGALLVGWWVAVLTYLLPRRAELQVAAADVPGAAVAAISALALVVTALWLQYCCKSPRQHDEADDTVAD